jgi:diketogulonate reductase-like aldo/keto reductase
MVTSPSGRSGVEHGTLRRHLPRRKSGEPMSRLTLSSTHTLRGGVSIPMLGLGVYQSRPGSETREAVKAALELGYRHVDTASVYGNERDVAKGIEESKVPRDEVFITTKLWTTTTATTRR